MKTTLALLALVLMVSGAGCRRGTDTGTPPAVLPAEGAAAPQAPAPSAAPAPPAPAEAATSKPEAGSKYHEVTLPAGTKIGVRLNDSVNSDTSKLSDPVDATVIQPIVISETEVVPAGAHMKGHVSAVVVAGKAKGRASLSLDFTALDISGDTYPVSAQISEAAPATKGADAAKAGIPAGGEAEAGGKSDAFPKGSVLSLRLAKPVTIRVANK